MRLAVPSHVRQAGDPAAKAACLAHSGGNLA
jgi:hypothetical protein